MDLIPKHLSKPFSESDRIMKCGTVVHVNGSKNLKQIELVAIRHLKNICCSHFYFLFFTLGFFVP